MRLAIVEPHHEAPDPPSALFLAACAALEAAGVQFTAEYAPPVVPPLEAVRAALAHAGELFAALERRARLSADEVARYAALAGVVPVLRGAWPLLETTERTAADAGLIREGTREALEHLAAARTIGERAFRLLEIAGVPLGQTSPDVLRVVPIDARARSAAYGPSVRFVRSLEELEVLLRKETGERPVLSPSGGVFVPRREDFERAAKRRAVPLVPVVLRRSAGEELASLGAELAIRTAGLDPVVVSIEGDALDGHLLERLVSALRPLSEGGVPWCAAFDAGAAAILPRHALELHERGLVALSLDGEPDAERRRWIDGAGDPFGHPIGTWHDWVRLHAAARASGAGVAAIAREAPRTEADDPVLVRSPYAVCATLAHASAARPAGGVGRTADEQLREGLRPGARAFAWDLLTGERHALTVPERRLWEACERAQSLRALTTLFDPGRQTEGTEARIRALARDLLHKGILRVVTAGSDGCC